MVEDSSDELCERLPFIGPLAFISSRSMSPIKRSPQMSYESLIMPKVKYFALKGKPQERK